MPERKYAELDDAAMLTWRAWQEADDAVKAWEARRDELKWALCDAAGDSAGGAFLGVPIFQRIVAHREPGFDWVKLRERYPELAEEFRKPGRGQDVVYVKRVAKAGDRPQDAA